MLLKHKEEIRTYVPVGLSLELYTIAPAAEHIELKEVASVIGNALYDALVSAYGTGALPITEERSAKLLPFAQKIIANLAIAEAMDVAQVQISESGVQRLEKEDEKTAYHYQKLEAQAALRRAGYAAQEAMLDFLEQNADDYPEYKASTAYQQAQELFISSTRQFDQQYNINGSARTYRALMPLMQRAEQLQVRPTLGDALFAEMKERQKLNTLTADDKILLVYIRLAVAHLTIADAVHELNLEVTPSGVQLTQTLATGNGSEEKKKPARGSLDQLAERTEGLGRRYLDQLRKYLLENASATRYASFFTSALYPTIVHSQQSTGSPAAVNRGLPTKKRIYGAL